jgi:hypothetical protein
MSATHLEEGHATVLVYYLCWIQTRVVAMPRGSEFMEELEQHQNARAGPSSMSAYKASLGFCGATIGMGRRMVGKENQLGRGHGATPESHVLVSRL